MNSSNSSNCSSSNICSCIIRSRNDGAVGINSSTKKGEQHSTGTGSTTCSIGCKTAKVLVHTTVLRLQISVCFYLNVGELTRATLQMRHSTNGLNPVNDLQLGQGQRKSLKVCY